jgi:hypothetical protein
VPKKPAMIRTAADFGEIKPKKLCDLSQFRLISLKHSHYSRRAIQKSKNLKAMFCNFTLLIEAIFWNKTYQ